MKQKCRYCPEVLNSMGELFIHVRNNHVEEWGDFQKSVTKRKEKSLKIIENKNESFS